MDTRCYFCAVVCTALSWSDRHHLWKGYMPLPTHVPLLLLHKAPHLLSICEQSPDHECKVSSAHLLVIPLAPVCLPIKWSRTSLYGGLSIQYIQHLLPPPATHLHDKIAREPCACIAWHGYHASLGAPISKSTACLKFILLTIFRFVSLTVRNKGTSPSVRRRICSPR